MRGKGHHVARPAQKRLQNLGVTEYQTSPNILSDVTSAVLTRASVLRSSRPL